METISDRLKYVRELRDKTTAEVAREVGISRQAYEKLEKGVTRKSKFLYETAVCLGVRPEWLRDGELPMESDDTAWRDYVRVPCYEVNTSVGEGSLVDHEEASSGLAFHRDWLAQRGIGKGKLAVIRATGDFMEPTIRDLDTILVDRSQRQLSNNAIFVMQVNGLLLVKRVNHSLIGDIIISSDNPLYREERIDAATAESLKIVGRVVWIGRDMM